VTGWATQKLSSACSRAEPWHFSHLPGARIAASGSLVSCCSPRNVIVAQVERVPFAAHCERLPIGLERRFVDTPRLCSGVTLRDLIERKGEGS
jgi:hypothetical protein